MLKSLVLPALLILAAGFPLASHADWECQKRIVEKQEVLEQLEQSGASRVEIIRAELAISDATYSCRLVTKVHYCLYQQTLRRTLVRELCQASPAEAQQAEADLERFTYWCKSSPDLSRL